MKQLLQYILSLGLMAAFLFWAFQDIDLAAVWQSARSASWRSLSAFMATVVASTFLRGWRWVALLRPIAPKVTIVDATLALAIGYTANLALPRSGEVIRALSIKDSHKVSVSAVLGTIVVERVLDLLALIILITISAMLVPGRLEQTYPWINSAATGTLVLSLCALAGMLALTAYGDRGIALVRRLTSGVSEKLADIVSDLLSKFVHGLSAMRTPGAYLEILLSSVLLNFGYILTIYWAFQAFNLHVEPHGLGLVAAVVITAISTIGVVIPTPGGVGSYHYFFGHSLTALFAIPSAPAMACATLAHALGTFTFVLIGVPAILLRQLAKHRSSHESDTD
jgi:uncharacterized protein (TIRG00374 family)